MGSLCIFYAKITIGFLTVNLTDGQKLVYCFFFIDFERTSA